VSSWASGSIDADTTIERFKKPKSIYRAYHELKETTDPKIQQHIKDLESDNYYERGEGLARYLKIMNRGYSPFELLKLKSGGPDSDWLPGVKEYTVITEWGNSLPFEHITGFDLFFKDNHVIPYIHRDYNLFPEEEGDIRHQPEHLQELIYFRWHVGKGFCVFKLDDNGNTIEEIPLDGHSVFFSHYNWHGKMASSMSASLVIKVEGRFTEEFRKKVYE
jgi:hypothetical protein